MSKLDKIAFISIIGLIITVFFLNKGILIKSKEEAYMKKALIYYNEKNYELAETYLRLSADEGNFYAQFFPNGFYDEFNGEDYVRDYSKFNFDLRRLVEKELNMNVNKEEDAMTYYKITKKMNNDEVFRYWQTIIPIMKKKADKGNKEFQYYIGILYKDRAQYSNKEEYEKLSEKYLIFASVSGHEPAQNFLIENFYDFLFFSGAKDTPEKLQKLDFLAKNNSNKAQFILGEFFLKENNLVKAENYLDMLEEKGNIDFCLDLISKYLDEKHSDNFNFEWAERYLTKLEIRGSINASSILGDLYLKRRDFGLAEYKYNEFLSANKRQGYYKLGNMYSKQNMNKLAEKYWIFAAEEGDETSQIILSELYYNQKKYDLAEKYLKILTNTKSQYYLGMIYKYKKESFLAEKHLKISADNNYSPAQFNLALFYADQNKSNLFLKYLNLAAENKNQNANYLLGAMHEKEKNYSLAINYYKEVVKIGKKRVTKVLDEREKEYNEMRDDEIYLKAIEALDRLKKEF